MHIAMATALPMNVCAYLVGMVMALSEMVTQDVSTFNAHITTKLNLNNVLINLKYL